VRGFDTVTVVALGLQTGSSNCAASFLSAALHKQLVPTGKVADAVPAHYPALLLPFSASLAGKVTQGIAAYERALALVPRQAEALYNLGVAYTEAGQIDKALFM